MVKRLICLALLHTFSPLHAKSDSLLPDVNLIREDRPVGHFHSIKISGNGTVHLHPGELEGLAIQADAETLQTVRSEVKDGCLYLSIKAPNGANKKPIDYYISVTHLDELNASGNIQILTDEKLTEPKFKLSMSGGSRSNLDLDVKELAIYASGNAKIEAHGIAHKQSIMMNGSGQFKGLRLLGQTASININGAGFAEVNAEDSLQVDVSGRGKVRYSGRPSIAQNITGSIDLGPAQQVNTISPQ